MDLKDIIGDSELQQNEYSLSRPTFGKDNQLGIVGWYGKSNANNVYILKCSICSQDSELYGEGYFRGTRTHLISGRLPCGCSKSPKRSKEQFATLCSRKASELGITFLGFVGEWLGNHTKIKMSCEKHGVWETGVAGSLIHKGAGCPGCKADITSAVKRKSDEVMIQSFFNSEAFCFGTKFWRSERVDSNGTQQYWFMSCPACGTIGEAQSSALQNGTLPCLCSSNRQRECYINLVKDGDTIIALKFGIANKSEQRVKQQNRRSVYDIELFGVWKFSDKQSCLRAERECLQELQTGIVSNLEMIDGWTETTYPGNLDKIIQIYEINGGIRV